MPILNLCTNYIYTKLFYNYFANIKKYDEKSFLYCPAQKKLKNVMSYTDLSNNYDNVSNLIISKIYGKFDKFTFFRKRRKYLKDLEDKVSLKEYDMVIAHSLFTDGYVAYKLKRKYGIEYCTFVQNGDINFFYKKLKVLNSLGNKVLINSKYIVVSSPAIKDYFLSKVLNKKVSQKIKEKIKVIPFGIDDYYIDNLYSNEFDSVNNLLCVGTICDNKNQLFLANAINKYNNEHTNKLNLFLAGKIVDEQYHKKIMEYDFVKYFGQLNRDELIDLYRRSQLFVLISKTETFGLVYAEALSQGLPIIYSKNQGFDKQFDDGYVGYPVDCLDINDVEKQLERAIDNYHTLKKNCSIASKKYMWNNVALQYYSLKK